jgi:hypothetical protein
MTLTSGRPAPQDFIFVFVAYEKCEPPHIDRRLFAGHQGAAAASLLRDCNAETVTRMQGYVDRLVRG